MEKYAWAERAGELTHSEGNMLFLAIARLRNI